MPAPRGSAWKEKQTMKHAVRMLILMVGLGCAYVTIAAPTFAENGPMPLCNPNDPGRCNNKVMTMIVNN
jgi:hypothetical protein